MYELKHIVAFGSFALGIIGIPTLAYTYERNKAHDTDLKKAEIAAGYPAEYWEAEATKAREHEETERAKIASEERLRLDERERRSQEAAAKREFEANAPDEYWEHLKTIEEEETKRQLNKQRYESEMAAQKAHQAAVRGY